MNFVKKVCGGVALFFVSSLSMANTDFLPISQINYNGNDNDLFFITPTAKWGDPGCPNAPYVHVRASVPGRQQILSIGLAAYMAGKKVQFWGACSTAPNEAGVYFDAFYIVVTN